jgi:lipopolysaccharide export system protein LptC
LSELADRERAVKRSWAAPGGFHDILIRLLKYALPAAVGVLLAYLLLSPLSKNKEMSFLLDKNKVAVARERLKVQSAQYRGLDDEGRPFTIDAARAVQATSSQPLVEISGMAARIQLAEGPATFRAERGRYNMESQEVDIIGPLLFAGADGYRLETRDVSVNLAGHTIASGRAVEGKMPLGHFSAQRMQVDLAKRTVSLNGRARLHIDQGGLR